MKNLILLSFLFCPFLLFSQHDIVKCDSVVCESFELSKRKISCLKAKRTDTYDVIFEKNKKNFTRHSISLETVQTMDLEELNNLTKKCKKRKYLKSFIQENSKVFKSNDRLFRELQLDDGFVDKDALRHNLELINDKYYALSTLLKVYDDFILNEEAGKRNFSHGLNENKRCLIDRINYIIDRDYCYYSDPSSSRKLIKGVSFYHDNDVFNPGINNEDYNYTGGGRIEIKTDFLKMRFLLDLLPFNRKLLSYQGLYFGTEAFTPYIRYPGMDEMTRDSLYRQDRPFGSYHYFGKTKYLLHYGGLWRAKSSFRVGTIGGNVGSGIQSVIHRDQTPKSIKVHGWENQIAHGGRFAWNIDYDFDLMLFSTTNNRDLFKTKKDDASPFSDRKEKFLGFNLYAIANMHLGNYLTAFDIGLGISGLNFKSQNGDNNICLRKNKKSNFNWYLNVKYRRVQHNSMLEGFGLFSTYEDDEYDDEPISVYQLTSDQVYRNVLFGDIGINYRINKTTFFYRLTFNTKEFKMDRNPFYGWGTIGMSFKG